MSDDEEDLDGLFGHLAREAGLRRDPGEHPPTATLAAYQEGRLSAEGDEVVRDHVAACEECSSLLLSLEGFAAKPAETGVADFETAADWRKLKSRLDEDAWFKKEEKASRFGRPFGLTLIAAALIAIVGVTLYTFWSPGSALKTLEPLHQRDSGERIESVRLPVTLLLRPPLHASFPEYRAEIRDQGERRVREVSGLKENASFELEVPLHRWALASGEYKIALLGLQDGRLVPVAEYAFRIAAN